MKKTKLNCKVWSIAVGITCLTGGWAGCDLVQYTQTKTTPEFIVSVTVSRHPLVAHEKTDMYVVLRQERNAVTGCRVRFAGHVDQREVGLQPVAANEPDWQEFPEQGQLGIYRGPVTATVAAGTWLTDIAVKCLGREITVPFPFDVIDAAT